MFLIAGVDEAGRGPLAGPVVAAAVILPDGFDHSLVKDSKAMRESARIKAYDVLCSEAHIAIASSGAVRIDEINIRMATLEAMRRAVHGLSIKPDKVLIDGRDVPLGLDCPAEAIIKGDQTVSAISAASIIAKVTRDRIMRTADKFFPEFYFGVHKGYGVKRHLARIESHGICALHRKSFAPVKKVVAKKHT